MDKPAPLCNDPPLGRRAFWVGFSIGTLLFFAISYAFLAIPNLPLDVTGKRNVILGIGALFLYLFQWFAERRLRDVGIYPHIFKLALLAGCIPLLIPLFPNLPKLAKLLTIALSAKVCGVLTIIGFICLLLPTKQPKPEKEPSRLRYSINRWGAAIAQFVFETPKNILAPVPFEDYKRLLVVGLLLRVALAFTPLSALSVLVMARLCHLLIRRQRLTGICLPLSAILFPLLFELQLLPFALLLLLFYTGLLPDGTLPANRRPFLLICDLTLALFTTLFLLPQTPPLLLLLPFTFYFLLQVAHFSAVELLRFNDRKASPLLSCTLGPPRAATCAILVHGFADSPEAWRREGELLAANGWRVYIPLLKPDGREETWIQTVVDLIQRAKTEHACVTLWGHSMGGAVSTVAAGRLAPDKLILWAPFFAPKLGRKRVEWLYLLDRLLFLWPFTPTFFPAIRVGKGNRPTTYRVRRIIPIESFRAMLQLQYMAEATHLSVPVTLLLAHTDRVVDNAAIQRALPDATTHFAHDKKTSHALTNAADWEENLTKLLESL